MAKRYTAKVFVDAAYEGDLCRGPVSHACRTTDTTPPMKTSAPAAQTPRTDEASGLRISMVRATPSSPKNLSPYRTKALSSLMLPQRSFVYRIVTSLRTTLVGCVAANSFLCSPLLLCIRNPISDRKRVGARKSATLDPDEP